MPNHIIEKAFKELDETVQLWTKQNHPEEPPKEEYTVHNNKKSQLAEFFVNEAAHTDYEFFSPVIDKITEIRKEFGI